MSIEQPTSNLVGLLMSIKEYKLGDICNVKTGNMNKIDAKEDGKYNFFTRSVNILKSDRYTADGNFTIIPGEGVFMPLYAEGKIAVHQRVYYIEANKNFSRDKYLYYWWTKNAFLLNLSAVGTTVKSLRLNNLIKPIIKLPDIETQQQIIDIIEPFEKMLNKEKIYI